MNGKVDTVLNLESAQNFDKQLVKLTAQEMRTSDYDKTVQRDRNRGPGVAGGGGKWGSCPPVPASNSQVEG